MLYNEGLRLFPGSVAQRTQNSPGPTIFRPPVYRGTFATLSTASPQKMSIFIAAGILGPLAHWLLFIHGEWHLQAATVVIFHATTVCLLLGFSVQTQGSLRGGVSTTGLTLFCYLIGLFTSIATYRARFHRLRNFPGPRLAAMSKLWHVWQCRDSRNHLVLERLRQQYGPFVRTGWFLPLCHHPSC